MKKLLVLLMVLIPALLLVFANIVYSAPPGAGPGALATPAPNPIKTFPALPTVMPLPSSIMLDTIVDIPDANLNAKLHAKTGVPNAQALYQSDLAALTGTLTLDNCGIANAKGLQYCKNVKRVNLDNNQLTTLPNMSGMTDLEWLILSNNKFASVPSGLFGVPHLQKLEMNNNPIISIDNGINALTSLRLLDLQNTDLSSFPNALLDTHITTLRFDGSPIGSISNDIGDMTHLTELYVSKTKLRKLPDSICSLSHLKKLDVSYNDLYDLPKNIGDHLNILTARGNKLTSIPKSILESPSLYSLDIALNRFQSLPSHFNDNEYENFHLEYNFLDISAGSDALELIDASPSNDKFFKPQLTPVKGLDATPAADSVTLSWSPCPDGSGSGATWKVKGYVVYQYKNGDMVKVSDVDKSQTSYTHTSLTPETAFDYRVGVDYRVVDPASSDDIVTRCYTKIEVTTLANSASTAVSPEVSAAVSPSEAPEVSAPESPEESSIVLPAAEQTDTAVPAEGAALPIWAIIIICAVVAGIAGTGTAFVILKARKPKA